MDRQKSPPGPDGRLLLGNLIEFSRDPLAFLINCAREYGAVARIRLFRYSVFLLNSPEPIAQVLISGHHNFRKFQGFVRTPLMRLLFGNSLLTNEGETWHESRRQVSAAFQHDQTAAHSAAIVALTQHRIKSWLNGEVRDIHQEMTELTLQIAAKCLFNAGIAREAKEVAEALGSLLADTQSPGSLVWLINNWLPTPGNLRIRRAVKRMDTIVSHIIAERRSHPASGKDILSLLMKAKRQDGSPLPDRLLRDEVMTLLLAGHETVAACLSWTFYLLSQYPTVRSNLEAELERTLGGRPPTYEDLGHLPYASMVILESLRLYPPGFGIGREALCDCEVGGYLVPAGTVLGMYQWVVHRDPKLFPDPERFLPERWTDELERRLPRCAYFPFGHGPRVCIGKALALAEAQLILSSVAQKHRLDLLPGANVAPFPCITMRPLHGIQMLITCRDARPSLSSTHGK